LRQKQTNLKNINSVKKHIRKRRAENDMAKCSVFFFHSIWGRFIHAPPLGLRVWPQIEVKGWQKGREKEGWEFCNQPQKEGGKPSHHTLKP
jgi:hypothetical protein